MNKRNKIRIRSLVNKINSGDYGTNDLEILLTDLRSYVNQNSFTRELGDFINHSEGKTKGKLHDAIAYMFYRMLFFTTYQGTNSPPLSVDTIFPIYFKTLLLVALKRKPIYDNIVKIGVNKDQAANIIKRILPDNLNGKLDKQYCTDKNLRVINECISLLAPGSEIDSEDIVDDIVSSIKILYNKIGIEIDVNSLNRDKLILHVFDILNAKDFTIDKKIVGYCSLHLERKEIHQSHLDSLKPREEQIFKKWSTFGMINLSGVVQVTNDSQKELNISFVLVASNLDSMKYIDESLLTRTYDYQGKEIISIEIPEIFTISPFNTIIELV